MCTLFKIEHLRMAWNGKQIPLDVEFKILNVLLKLIGIKLKAEEKDSCSASSFYKISFGLSVISFIYIITEVLYCGIVTYVTSTVVIFNMTVLILTLVLWITIFRRKTQISSLIKKLSDVHETDGTTDTNMKTKMRVLIFYISILPVLASFLSFFTIRENALEFYLHCYLYGSRFPEQSVYWKQALLLLFLTIENFIHFLFPNLATILIFFLLTQFHKIVKKFILDWEFSIQKQNFEYRYHLLKSYSDMRKDFDCLHEAISFVVFIILAQKFLTLFFSLTAIFSSSTKDIFIELLESGLFAFNAIVSLAILIMSGSKIQETHGKIKSLCLDTLLVFFNSEKTFPDIKDTDMLFLMKTFVEKEDMIVSAAGIIPLTRSLFLQTAAALITYGVVIVQNQN